MPTIPSGAETEVAFISGVTNTAKIAGTSFWTWRGDNPATYSSTTSGASKWGGTTLSTAGTPGGNVTYWFDAASNWTTTEKNALAAGLSLWSAEANISFSLASSASTANQIFYRGTDKSAYENHRSVPHPTSAVNSSTDGHTTLTKISIDTSVPGWHVGTSFATEGGYAWATTVHEIGHMLGLGHGGPYNGNVNARTQQFSAYDTQLWSVMSYIDPMTTSSKFFSSYPVTGTNWGNWDATTPMILDILAIQRIYGPATSGPLASGGQIFGFNTNITGPVAQWFDFNNNQHPVVTIWDGGINNTLDLSGFSLKSTINLNPGTFSSANGLVNNIAIAMDTVVETAIGGSGDDTFIGSAANNTFRGNGGNDTIDGGAGIDSAIFAGLRSQFTLTALGGTSVRVTGPSGSGTDTLTNVERLVFNDQTVIWPTGGGGGAADDFAATSATLGVVTIGGSATGSLETVTDHDWFRVTLTAGVTYTISLTGALGGGGTLDDPYLRVRNSAGTQVAENDDIASGTNRDSLLVFTPTSSGTYFIDAGAFNDAATGTYRLSITAPGSSDDFADSRTDVSSPMGQVTVGGSRTGSLEVAADRDWFAVTLTAGTSYTINLTGAQGGGGTLSDPYLYLRSSTGALLAENDDIVLAVNVDSQLVFTAASSGTYYVEAGSYQDASTGTYTVRVATTSVNDDFADSFTDTSRPFGQVSVGGSRTGNLETTGDRDWIAVTLSAGTTYTINLTGSTAAGGTLEDPYVYLHNSAGTLLAQNDDIVDGVNRGSRLTFAATSSGTYYVEAGSYQDTYTGTYTVRVTGNATSDDFANSLTDTARSFGQVSVNGTSTGYLEVAGDRDWFRVQLTAGSTYMIEINGMSQGIGSLEDPYLRVRSSTGTLLAENDDVVDGVVRDSILEFTATTTGTYYLEAGAFQDNYAGTYRLGVSSAVVVTNSIDNSITKLYVGYFNRAPDSAGETFWVSQLESGLTLGQIAQSFSVQPESTNLYSFLANPNSGNATAVKAFVDAIYINLFNRAPDVAGESFWIQQLQSGASTAGAAILNITAGAQGNDAITVDNKVTVGNYYNTQVFNNHVQFTLASAQDALNGVTFTAASVAAGRARVDAYVATAPHSQIALETEDVAVTGLVPAPAAPEFMALA